MFHSFQSQTIKLPKRQAGYLMFLVALQNNQVVAIDNKNLLMQYKIPSGNLIKQISLAFRVRRIAVIDDDTLVAIVPADRAIYQIKLSNSQITPIHTFATDYHFNTHHVLMREKEYFSTMRIRVFKQAQACFLRQERTEERKIRLHFLSRNRQSAGLKDKDKWKHTQLDHNINGSIIKKFDQKSKVAFFKQQVDQNGSFMFQIYDYLTEQLNTVQLQCQSFNPFSIVRAVCAYQTGVLVSLNHKTPQIIFFNNNSQNRSQLINTNLLWIVPYGHFILNLALSKQQKSKGRLQLRTPEGQLMDASQTIYDKTSISKNGELILNYTEQNKDSGWIVFTAIRILRKEKLLLHLLEKSNKNRLSDGFMREVISLFQS